MITTTKIKSTQVRKLPGNNYDGRSYPQGLWENNFVGAWVGKTNSGKSTSMMCAILDYVKTNTFDKLYCFSPSILEDDKYKQVNWTETYSDFDEPTLKKIVQEQEDDIQEFKDYKEKLKIYEKFMKSNTLKNFTQAEKKILASMIILDDDGNELIEKPTNDYGRIPAALIVMDDLGSSGAYSNNVRSFMNAMACRCRHKNITMFHAVQHLYQLPRALRQQCQVLCLFKTKDIKLLKEIARENSSNVTEDQFMNLYDKAMETGDPHTFMCCDFKNECYRINYDKIMSMNNIDE